MMDENKTAYSGCGASRKKHRSAAALSNIIKLRIPQKRGPTFFAKKYKKIQKTLDKPVGLCGRIDGEFRFSYAVNAPLLIRELSRF